MNLKWTLFLALTTFFTTSALAIPINTNVALPVAKNRAVVRSQVRGTKVKNQETDFTVPFIIAYGITAKTALIINFSTRISPTNTGLGDIPITVRQTLYQYDVPLLTSRFGLLLGIKLPLGTEPFTSDSTDWRFGGVYTFQHDSHEVDLSTVYSINTEAKGIERGDVLRHDIAYQLRLWPWVYPDHGIPSQLNFDIELNGIYEQKTDVDGTNDLNSGGYRLYLSPGLQWVSKQIILEASILIPIIQSLNGIQTEEDYGFNVGFRMNLP